MLLPYFQTLAAKAQLLGESAVYVKQGSTISLTCEINLYSEPPPDINWIHGSKVRRQGSVLIIILKLKINSHQKPMTN